MHSPSESGAELFRVDYFDRPAFLAQSPQFYKQMAMASGFNRVFEIGPVFRANPSFTTRHDTEFTSVDMEISWIDSHEDVMEMEERWLHCILTTVQTQFGKRIEREFDAEVVVPSIPFPRVDLQQARQIVWDRQPRKEKYSLQGDLDPEAERVLCRFIQETYEHEFVFVTDYDWSVRPFVSLR